MAIRLTFRSIPILAVGAYLAACGAAGNAAASGCDVVAARDGSDAAAGTLDQPLKTAQAVADRLQPGQTGCLREGTYAETPNGPHVLLVLRGGRAGAPVTIRSYPGERAKLVGVVWITKGADHVTLSELSIDGRGADSGTAVTVQMMAEHTVLEKSDVTNRRLSNCAIVGSNDGWGAARDVVIRGNVFRDCGDPAHGYHDHGIYVQNLTGGEITGNVFYGSAAWAVQLYPNANGVRVAHNVMDGNYGGVIVAGEDDTTSSGNVIERNVITNSGAGRPVKTSWTRNVGSGNVARDNCVDGTGGDIEDDRGLSVRGTIVAPARYVDRAGRDYRLALDSACRAVAGDPATGAAPATGTTPAAGLRPPSKTAPAKRKAATKRSSCRRAKGRAAKRRCARAARRARAAKRRAASARPA